MIVIGLTGGIGTGKSTVSDYLKKKGCFIIDADVLSREMTQKGKPAIKEIAIAFGNQLIDEDGNLDRKALGKIVFYDKKKLDILQAIITNKVVECIEESISALKTENYSGIVVIDAPLLFECGMEHMSDENWLVTANLDVRLERVKKRDGLSEEEIISRINNQMSQEDKEKKSNCVLNNSGSLGELYSQIDKNLERIQDEF